MSCTLGRKSDVQLTFDDTILLSMSKIDKNLRSFFEFLVITSEIFLNNSYIKTKNRRAFDL